jgi:hypothetical protein
LLKFSTPQSLNLGSRERRQRRPAKVRASVGPGLSFLTPLYQSQRRIFSPLRHFSVCSTAQPSIINHPSHKMITRSQAKLAAAAAADALRNQPFRFLDLPKELRLMVYDYLMDNPKNSIKFTAPSNLDIFDVHLDGMYFPSLLRVSRLVRDEYKPFCLRRPILWISYACDEPPQPDEENGDDESPAIPRLSEWLVMPIEVLESVKEVIFQFQEFWMIPDNSKSDMKCFSHLSLARYLTVRRPFLWYCRMH